MRDKVVSLAEERTMRNSTYLGTVTVEVYQSPQGRPFAGAVDLSKYAPGTGAVFRRSIWSALIQVMRAIKEANDEQGVPPARELGINLRPFKEER